MAQPRNIAKHPFRDYSLAGMMVAVNDGTGLQYLLTDHLGSTVAVTNASGTLTSQQRYLPFGAARTIPNSPILGTDFTYTGQRDLGDMGLMDYDARFYSQSLGRFLQPDTLIPNVSIPQTWNRYSYTQNNPIKFTDPSGHWIETAFDLISLGMDIADIAQNGLNLANGAALVLDVAAVILPGVPAVAGVAYKAIKAANAVDNAMDAAKIVNKADNIADTAKALKNGAEELGTCLVNSFRADTDVETSEGPKDISAIQIGDYVLAWDEASGSLGYYEVTNAFHHTDAVVTEVILSGEWIETTPEHPFYVEGEGWVYAEDLQIGDKVRQADGTTGRVWLKWNVYKTQEMYNLTVDTAHTFFVGESQWLVHNSCGIDLGDFSPSNKTVFSGAFDPDSGNLLLKPSGDTLLANGSKPPRVNRTGGHQDVAEMLRNEFGVPAKNPMGFTVFYEKLNSVRVDWISGLNRYYGGGDRLLPVQYRKTIIDKLKQGLNVLVE